MNLLRRFRIYCPHQLHDSVRIGLETLNWNPKMYIEIIVEEIGLSKHPCYCNKSLTKCKILLIMTSSLLLLVFTLAYVSFRMIKRKSKPMKFKLKRIGTHTPGDRKMK